ncbi:MAG: carbonic anhydrase [Pirellulaceae bacterium]|nr:carbonic anhydrase [Pirellulaceae bacterium]
MPIYLHSILFTLVVVLLLQLQVEPVVCADTPFGFEGSDAGELFEAGPQDKQDPVPRNKRTQSQSEQSKMTPDDVIEIMKLGNRRFMSDSLTKRVHTKQVRAAALGQFPKAIVLGCVDSRVPVEDVFDLGIGDVFVARIAGNFANTDIIGSMEFACKVSGSMVVMVMGHEDCGAIMGAIDRVQLGNLTATLNNLQPAVQAVPGFEGDRDATNGKFVQAVADKMSF